MPRLLLSSARLSPLGTERNSLRTRQVIHVCVVHPFLFYLQVDIDMPALFTLKQRQ